MKNLSCPLSSRKKIEIPQGSKIIESPKERHDADHGSDDEDVEGDGSDADEEAREQVQRSVDRHRRAEVQPQVRHRHGHRGGHRGRRRRRGGHCRAVAADGSYFLSLEIARFL